MLAAVAEPFRSLLALLLPLVLVTGCWTAGVRPGQDSAAHWVCSPIDPAAKSLPDQPCFRAVLASENEISLQWRVTNSGPQVYIYDDFGVNFDDIGLRPATCPAAPKNTCFATVTVAQGGFHRWRLHVQNDRGDNIYAPASITVPSPPSPIELTGGGFVDVLAPTGRHIFWTRTGTDVLLDPQIEDSWIEVRAPGSFGWARLEQSESPGSRGQVNVPDSLLRKPGNITYRFRECHVHTKGSNRFCSAPRMANLQVGTDRFLNQNPLYTDAGEDLELLFTARSGNERRLSSPTLVSPQNGKDFVATSEGSYSIDGALLTPGRHQVTLSSCVSGTDNCTTGDTLSILVDFPVRWETGRHYTNDFRAAVAHQVRGVGLPLDITYDVAGGIWLINEFSTSIEHISPEGAVESITIPLARYPGPDPSSLEVTKPFASALFGDKHVPSNFSITAERVARIGSKLWFTQGGSYIQADIKNNSRVISFDPSLVDSPSTLHDDRICIFNVPVDDRDRRGNSTVIGLTGAANRIWIGESHGIFGQEASEISSFIPDPDKCENLLVFEDPEALARQSLQYCKPGRTPEQDGCMERLLLDELPPGLKVAQLATDPVDGSVWFTDAHGHYLGNLVTDGESAITIYRLPIIHTDLGEFAGFTWSLRVDEGAVYAAEFATRHILRFDKATATFAEIEIPASASEVTLHSLDIDSATDRLWFSLHTTELFPVDKEASTIGYIDLAGWRRYIADPENTGVFNGVIYTGLEPIGAPESDSGPYQAFTGIAIDPASGKIAVASFHRRQVTELTPTNSFRP